MRVLQVAVMHLEAPEEVVFLGDADAVGERGAQGAAQGPGGRQEPRPQLLRLHRQRGLLLCPGKSRSIPPAYSSGSPQELKVSNKP